MIGVDTGGTFTDLVASSDGELRIHKLLSTPSNPAQAILAGLDALQPGGLAAVTQVAHGTTVATNAILERKGAKAALLMTAGFRDVLFIGRQNRPVLYALQPKLPPPLIPRELCFDVPERLDHTGAALTPLDVDALDVIIDQLAAAGVESVAVCFLYSYVNPAHELAVRERIVQRAMLDAGRVILSHEVLPEFREYERASTVALEASVRPVISRYFQHLEDHLPAGCGLRVMKSDGGVISARHARTQAIQTALSGPAAGVIGAFHLAQLAGFERIITMDIGGTSTDVALCPGGLMRRPESEIDGLPLRVRLLDIETVGAGGGSIARLDAGGALRVGPESAGATPGPIAYGRGGTQITVSDANIVLGRLDAAHFLGGAMALDVESAHAAVTKLADSMGARVEAAALGILNVANTNIDRAIRRVSIARGYDPRDFTLVAFGGAGPLHACDVAERLQIPRVLIPRYPGVLCAFGLLMADVALDYSRSVLGGLTESSAERFKTLLDEMSLQARADLTREGIHEANMRFQPLVDLRYRGQAYELTVSFSDDLAAAFHQAHRQTYGYALPDRPIETVNLRLHTVGVTDKPVLRAEALGNIDARSALVGQANAPNGDALALYDRDRLRPGMRFSGGALVFQLDSTIYIAPGWSASVDGYRNLLLEHI